MLRGKIWGVTKALLVTPLIEVHEIEIEPNSHCSLHKHNFKHNAFYVLDGELEIHVQKNAYALTDVTTLLQGDMTTVPPGEFHQFRTGEVGCKALEIYYLEPLSEDIVRQTIGGKDGKEVGADDSWDADTSSI